MHVPRRSGLGLLTRFGIPLVQGRDFSLSLSRARANIFLFLYKLIVFSSFSLFFINVYVSTRVRQLFTPRNYYRSFDYIRFFFFLNLFHS